MNEHDRLVDRAARDARTVLFIGGLDAGKSTLARAVCAYALTPRPIRRLHRRGPRPEDRRPARHRRHEAHRFARRPHARSPRRRRRVCRSWGRISPQGHLLPLVTGIARLHDQALAEGTDLVVVDTSGMVSGHLRPAGQVPQGGAAPARPRRRVCSAARSSTRCSGVIERFFSVDVVSLGVHPAVVPTSVEQRAEHRQRAMARYFRGDLNGSGSGPPSSCRACLRCSSSRSWIGCSSASPTARARTRASGYLEYVAEDGALRLISPVADPPKALRLGSVRLEESYRAKRVDLRNLFGTE